MSSSNNSRKMRIRITADQQAQVRFWTKIGRREPSDFHGLRARNKIQQILGDDIFEALWEDEDLYELEIVSTLAETGIFAPPLPVEAMAPPPGPCGSDAITVPQRTPPPTVGYSLSEAAPIDPVVNAWSQYHRAVMDGEDSDAAALRAGFTLGQSYKAKFRGGVDRQGIREQIHSAAERLLYSSASPTRFFEA